MKGSAIMIGSSVYSLLVYIKAIDLCKVVFVTCQIGEFVYCLQEFSGSTSHANRAVFLLLATLYYRSLVLLLQITVQIQRRKAVRQRASLFSSLLGIGSSFSPSRMLLSDAVPHFAFTVPRLVPSNPTSSGGFVTKAHWVCQRPFLHLLE